MSATLLHERRQLWGYPSGTVESTPTCTPFAIPSGGIIILDPSFTVTLTRDAQFSPACTGSYFATGLTIGSEESDFGGAFYASTTPLIYIVAATTVLAWVLLIVTLVIPGRIRNSGSDKGPSFLAGRGIISGVSARQTSPNGGSRPWLQKGAALAVSIALTISTADTFKSAEHQYSEGYLSAVQMREQVAGSTEIKIMRVVSDVFLWLAQVQTLIRLFPRHKEKLVIKWIGFLLIILDVIFSCLNSFLVTTTNRPRLYQDAIPALSYLFQLSLSLLYAAWVFYYVITKRRFAFYNSKMPNICIIAIVSMIAILVPVAFFVADVSQRDVAAWGDYFRWVGAAAGSIVVWEWVERIEALESDERKEGVLGREVFEGDDMLGERGHDRKKSNSRRHMDPKGGASTSVFGGLGGLASRLASSRPSRRLHGEGKFQRKAPDKSAIDGRPFIDSREKSLTMISESESTPTRDATCPVDRENTASAVSASSTVYAVHYHRNAPSPLHAQQTDLLAGVEPPVPNISSSNNQVQINGSASQPVDTQPQSASVLNQKLVVRTAPAWIAATNPFKRKRTTPPIEIRNAMSSNEATQPQITPAEVGRTPLGRLDTSHTARNRTSFAKTNSIAAAEQRKPTVIPAPPRGRTWSPDAFQGQLDRIDLMTGTVPSPELHGPLQHRSTNLSQSVQFAPVQPSRESNSDRPLFLPAGSLGAQVHKGGSVENHVHHVPAAAQPPSDVVTLSEGGIETGLSHSEESRRLSGSASAISRSPSTGNERLHDR